MWSIKQFLVMALCALLCVPSVLAQDPQPVAKGSTGAAQDMTIIIQQQQVRFIAQKAGEEMRLQVFDQSGELVFDSGTVAATEVTWPLQAANGEMLKSGLYAYTLSMQEASSAEARLRRGHFIVDRAKDRDGRDKLWVTSQNESGVGTELTVAKDEAATVAGAAISNSEERTIGQRTEIADRDAAGRAVEVKAQSQAKPEKGTGKEAAAAVAAGTVGQIAKFTSTTEVGNSVMVEQNTNIGIGVTAPKHRLSIAGGPLWTTNQWNGAIELQHGGAIGWQTNGEGQRAGLGHSNGGTYFFRTNSDPGTGGSPATYDLVINDAGNVGIGTTTPQSKLDVAGLALIRPGGTGGSIQFGNPNGETGMSIVGSRRADVRFNGSALSLAVSPNTGIPDPRNGVVISASGNVGIGTVTPGTKLHVESSGAAEITVKSFDERAILALDNGLSHPIRYVWTLESGLGGTYTSLFGIYNRNVNKPGLTIDGNLLVSVKALEITGGADFAENFDVSAEKYAGNPSESEIQPGMVVAIDPANPGKLSLSGRAYDRRVAGIISGAGGVKPGMTMGQEQTLANGKYPVALSGRVYVWVDAARGAIQPGDLLTTSATPGHAMKARHTAQAQGAIIGKAMTGLKAGKGLVLVLVTLQ